jgi:hypothetical protein
MLFLHSLFRDPALGIEYLMKSIAEIVPLAEDR